MPIGGWESAKKGKRDCERAIANHSNYGYNEDFQMFTEKVQYKKPMYKIKAFHQCKLIL